MNSHVEGPVRLGVIGFGIMGERLLRAALDQPPPVEIAGVWDPSPEAMARLAEVLPRVQRFSSGDAVVSACDCLYIATPPAVHLGYARAAHDRGLAVFCEKPLSADLCASRAFVQEVESRRLRTGVNFVFASSPAVAQIEAWIDEGLVGEFEGVDIEVTFAAWPRPWQLAAAPWLSKRAEGGFTREVVSHFLFLTRRVLGPLEVSDHEIMFPDGDGSETALKAKLTTGGLPVMLTGSVGTTDKPDHNIWMLNGKGGSVRLRDWSVAERCTGLGGWAEAPDAIPNEKARPLILQGQLEKVARMTRGLPHNLATAREALEVQEIVEALLA